VILVIFGLIAVGAALLLIYYSKNPGSGGLSGVTRARKVQATVVPEKRYKKSEDGKVVYLFDDDDEEDAHETSGNDDPDGSDRPNGPNDSNGEEGKE
jgi:hypothetical protein